MDGGGDDKGNKKPIENIVADVLSSINTARNGSTEGGEVNESNVLKPFTTTTSPTTKLTSTTAKTTTAATPRTSTTKKISTTKKAAASSKKGSKPVTTTTKKPPRTQSQNQNQNKLKTELGATHQQQMSSSTGYVNVKKQPQTNSNSNPGSSMQSHPHKKVELPMIIMLDNDKPLPPRNKRPEMPETTEYRLPGKLQIYHYPLLQPLNSILQELIEPLLQFLGIPSDNDSFDTANDDDGGNTWLSSPGAEISQHDEADAEADQDDQQAQIPIEYTTLRPYVPPPTKASNKDQYWSQKRPGYQSTSSTRPNEFYDDEIFGS